MELELLSASQRFSDCTWRSRLLAFSIQQIVKCSTLYNYPFASCKHCLIIAQIMHKVHLLWIQSKAGCKTLWLSQHEKSPTIWKIHSQLKDNDYVAFSSLAIWSLQNIQTSALFPNFLNSIRCVCLSCKWKSQQIHY